MLCQEEMPRTEVDPADPSLKPCSACLYLLDQSKFQMDVLQESLRKAMVVRNQASSHGLPTVIEAMGTAVNPGELSIVEMEPEPAKHEKSEVKSEAEMDEMDEIWEQDSDYEIYEGVQTVKPVKAKPQQILQLGQCFQQLPPGTRKKQLPVKCLLCSAVAGKEVVFDRVSLQQMKYVDTTFANRPAYSGQSCCCQPCSAPQEKEGRGSNGVLKTPDVPTGPFGVPLPHKRVPCQGFSFKDFPDSRIARVQSEYAMYMQHTNITAISATAKTEDGETEEVWHKYQHDPVTGEYVMFHRGCSGHLTKPVEREAEDDDRDEQPAFLSTTLDVCAHCRSLAVDKSFFRNVVRFWCKYQAAMLLRASLYGKISTIGGSGHSKEEMCESMNRSTMVEICSMAKLEADKLSGMTILELQKYVRCAFLSIPMSRQSMAMRSLIATVVQPSLQVNVHGCSLPNMSQAEVLARHLTEGSLSSVSEVDLKLACFIGAGALRSHPMLHGILVTMVEKIRREQRGVFSLKGLKLAEAELAIVQDAGMALSIAGCNKEMLRHFSMSHAVPRMDMHNLLKRGLPDAFCSLTDIEVLQQNALMVNNMFPLCAPGSQRRLAFAFDKTYLLKQATWFQLDVFEGPDFIVDEWWGPFNILEIYSFYTIFNHQSESLVTHTHIYIYNPCHSQIIPPNCLRRTWGWDRPDFICHGMPTCLLNLTEYSKLGTL